MSRHNIASFPHTTSTPYTNGAFVSIVIALALRCPAEAMRGSW